MSPPILGNPQMGTIKIKNMYIYFPWFHAKYRCFTLDVFCINHVRHRSSINGKLDDMINANHVLSNLRSHTAEMLNTFWTMPICILVFVCLKYVYVLCACWIEFGIDVMLGRHIGNMSKHGACAAIFCWWSSKKTGRIEGSQFRFFAPPPQMWNRKCFSRLVLQIPGHLLRLRLRRIRIIGMIRTTIIIIIIINNNNVSAWYWLVDSYEQNMIKGWWVQWWNVMNQHFFFRDM